LTARCAFRFFGLSSSAPNGHLQEPTLQPFTSERRELGLRRPKPRQHFTMSLGETKEPIELGTPGYVPLASYTLVLRTRREVRQELERLKARRSLLRRALLPSLLCMGIGLLIMVHPEFAKSWICKLASLYYWALAVLIPWLVVRKEKKYTSRQLL
jgi:hypothetical protein